MFQKVLRPIRDKLKYSELITQEIEYRLYFAIFKPLLAILDYEDIKNAKSSVLVGAFLSKKIYYADGYVLGSFNAAISKQLSVLGKFNKVKKGFKIALSSFPPEIRSAIAQGNHAESEMLDRLSKKTREIKGSLIPDLQLGEITNYTLKDLNEQFNRLTPKDLEIPLEMNESQRQQITEDYHENLNLSIKGWADEAVERLRYRVEEHVGQGLRAEKLKDIIQSEYGVTKNKAKFIARQETSLLVSKFRQVRYEDAGINMYKWSTSEDERVRPDHKALDNRIFSFDNPPITNRATGAKNNPGQDFGCRCVPLPVIRVASGELVSA